jgi:Ca2+-binding RTX toxin-like protein
MFNLIYLKSFTRPRFQICIFLLDGTPYSLLSRFSVCGLVIARTIVPRLSQAVLKGRGFRPNIFDNKLEGRSGGDRIFGGLGNDTLLGGDGIDILNGGDGSDNISGDKGNDTMIGGNGSDSFSWVDGDGSDVIRGDAGSDNLFFSGSLTQGDVITLNPVGTEIVLQRTNLVPITLRMESIETFNAINTGGGDDLFIVKDLLTSSGVTAIHFNGEGGNDFMQITNTSAKIIASGGLGNDAIVGANSNDSLFGDEGNDTLLGGAGDDTLTGANSLSPTPGRGEIDILVGGAGQDTFVLNNFYNDGDGLADGDASNFLDNPFASFDGTGDFARILDFRVGEDKIQLSGPRSSYELRTIKTTNSLSGGSSAPDVGIFKKGAFLQPAELIAIVQDAPTNLNLASTSQFTFI